MTANIFIAQRFEPAEDGWRTHQLYIAATSSAEAERLLLPWWGDDTPPGDLYMTTDQAAHIFGPVAMGATRAAPVFDEQAYAAWQRANVAMTPGLEQVRSYRRIVLASKMAHGMTAPSFTHVLSWGSRPEQSIRTSGDTPVHAALEVYDEAHAATLIPGGVRVTFNDGSSIDVEVHQIEVPA